MITRLETSSSGSGFASAATLRATPSVAHGVVEHVSQHVPDPITGARLQRFWQRRAVPAWRAARSPLHVLWPQLGQRQVPQPVIANEVGEGLAVPGSGRWPLPQAGQPLFGVLPHGLRCRQAGRARGAAGRSAVPAPGCDAVPRPARRDGRFLRLHAEDPARRAAVTHLPAMPVIERPLPMPTAIAPVRGSSSRISAATSR